MKKRSEDQWRELFARQETSGVSAAVFCKENDLCPKYFSLRRKQLVKAVGKAESDFVRIQVDSATKHDTSGTIASSLVIYSHSGQLVFGVLPQPGWLAQLLKALA